MDRMNEIASHTLPLFMGGYERCHAWHQMQWMSTDAIQQPMTLCFIPEPLLQICPGMQIVQKLHDSDLFTNF